MCNASPAADSVPPMIAAAAIANIAGPKGKRDVPVEVPLSAFAVKVPDQAELLKFLAAQNFKKLADRVTSRYGFKQLGDGSKVHALQSVEVFYELVQDIGTLKKWISAARAKGLVAIDTETTSLDAKNAKLVGISLSYAEGRAWLQSRAQVQASRCRWYSDVRAHSQDRSPARRASRNDTRQGRRANWLREAPGL